MKPKDLLDSVASSIRRPTGFQRLDEQQDHCTRRVRNAGFSHEPVNIELRNLGPGNTNSSNINISTTPESTNETVTDHSSNRESHIRRHENENNQNSTEAVPPIQFNANSEEFFFSNAKFHVYNPVTEDLDDDRDDAFPSSGVRLAFTEQPLENDLMNLTNAHGQRRQKVPFQNRGRIGNHERSLWNCLHLIGCGRLQEYLKKHAKAVRILLMILTFIFFIVVVVASMMAAKYIWKYQTNSHSTTQEFSMKILRNQTWPLQDVQSRRMNISFLKVSKEQELSSFKKRIEKADKEGGDMKPPATNDKKKEHVDPYHPKINGKPTILETNVNGSYYIGQKMLLNKLKENSSELDQIIWKGLAGSVAVAEMRERLNISQITDSLEGSLPVDMCYQEPNTTCNATGWYRSIDGKCNNMFKKWGSRYSPFRRIIVNQGKWETPSHKIPKAITVSKQIYWRAVHADPTNAAVMLPMWGIFILQDTLKTAISPINCCNHNHSDPSINDTIDEICNLKSASLNTYGAIALHHDHDHKCSIKKSLPAQFASCGLEPRLSFNLATSFIDASNIYGSSVETVEKLREKKLGRLKIYAHVHPFQKHGFLPTERSMNGSCWFKSPLNMEVGDCAASGNPDVNLIATLTAINTLFLRQHNKIAEILHHHNPHWNDEQLFQESRRILIAQIQHITYNEYLPLILGKEMINFAGLSLESGETYYRGCNQNVDPSVSNAYAGAVGYFWYSMIPANQKLSVTVQSVTHDFLWDTLTFALRPHFLVNGKHHLEALLIGLTTTETNLVGLGLPPQLHKFHFRIKNSSQIVDLVRIAIEWGRDLDLPPYLEWRKVCGFTEAKSFHQFKKFWYPAAYDIVTSIYKDIQEVDLLVGMLAENHINGGKVGPTLACLIADQFLRFRQGDRHWYEADVGFHHFTQEQLKAIRKTTLARIICDNLPDVKEIQQWPMFLASADGNPTFSCSEPTHVLPKLHFLLWKEHARDYNAYEHVNDTHATVYSQQWTLNSSSEYPDDIENDIISQSKTEN